jgi:hypothetical protein
MAKINDAKGGAKGVFIEDELTGLLGRFDLQLEEFQFPRVRGAGSARAVNLQNDLNAQLDALLTAAGVSQRVRVRCDSVSPLRYAVAVYSGVDAMTLAGWPVV